MRGEVLRVAVRGGQRPEQLDLQKLFHEAERPFSFLMRPNVVRKDGPEG